YFSDQFNAQEEPKQDLKALVRNKEIELTKMSVDEAVLQMELLGHDFYLFLNEDNHKVTLIYQRNDGNYATIEVK
ncbi:MAG: sigma 54 modulation/S30EA ribosomal C-terminal domain-containing protein, partial [Bacilli bacterium]